MTTLRKTVTTVAGAACLTTLTMLGTGCESANSMAEAAARKSMAHYDADSGELYRLYEYYPNEQVYRGVYSKDYFWHNGSRWTQDADLPQGIVLNQDFYELIELPSGRPYLFHDEVVQDHPSTAQLQAIAASLESAEAEAFNTGRPAATFIVTAPTD